MKDRIKKASRHTNQNEGLIFEKSSPGSAVRLPARIAPPSTLPTPPPLAALPARPHSRQSLSGANHPPPWGPYDRLSEVSERSKSFATSRVFRRGTTPSTLGMYPLGSCTMKYNPRVNEFVARLDGIATEHPISRKSFRKAASRFWLGAASKRCLLEIHRHGCHPRCRPAGRAHGELTGLLADCARTWRSKGIRGRKC